MIPRVAHFVFGLEEQLEPFHLLHYVSLESCRRVLEPEAIYFHHKHLPWGDWWDRIRPHLTLVDVDDVEEVLAADYSSGRVPGSYRYAHHADFMRLDALIERGGVYADIDTIFVRPFPNDLFDASFVIGAEAAVRDELTGIPRPSLCNALLMAERGAPFARVWRDRMAAALNGTWSNHSGFLSEQLSRLMPSEVRVEPQASFFSFGSTPAELSKLLLERRPVPAGALSVHLWAHLWWERGRRDFCDAHAGWYTPSFVQQARTTLAEIVRPYLADRAARGTSGRSAVSQPAPAPSTWGYLSLDESSGYGIAAERCMAALEDSGLQLEWTPLVPGANWGLGYQPAPLAAGAASAQVVVAHLVAEYLPIVRERSPAAFLVGHTVWDTDRLPEHWIPCLDAADLVVVPSRFSAEAISGSAVDAPVAVVPHVAPPAIPRTAASWPGVDPEVFVFYTIGEWNERKAVFKTVEAYLRAFTARDRVLLIVKTSHRDRRVVTAEGGAVAGPGDERPGASPMPCAPRDPPAIRLVNRPSTAAEISQLHRRGDCFVSLCRSEGWGLGAFDAAAYGNPVVITGYGGQLDYLADSPYLVGYELIPVEDPISFPSFAPDQRWAEPDVDHGAELLRDVVANPERAAAVSSSIATEIGSRYRPEAVATKFRAVVEQHRSAHRPRQPTATTVRRP